ncbi:MAG: hypothetical protein JSV59_03315 [Flavobacteriaceae bacterium]|nr:MAG: hypothetical protein JSV59_03315 [Flavobacteriaceae bacterium]
MLPFFRKISKYIVEISIIFIGVMMAFLADNWREENQDSEDYRKIMNEIENNIRLDSIEMVSDKSDVIKQIECLDMFLDDSHWEKEKIDGNQLAPCFRLMLFVDWPDYVLTGFNQLLSSKIVTEDYDSELMFRIYEYYQWTDFHYLRIGQTVTETYDLQRYLINNEFYPEESDAFTQGEIEVFQKLRVDAVFRTQLKYLRANRKEELRIYNYMQDRTQLILNLFRKAK